MGLDMYLDGVFSSYRMFDYNIGYVKVHVQMGYWRKANQIHKWFVDNVQRGVDNCADYYVSNTQLVELKEICETVLADKSKASELLPTEDGFFFGSQEYDEFYFGDIEETIEIIDRALQSEAEYFKYSSSW